MNLRAATMDKNKHHQLIVTGKLCPYCHKRTELIDSKVIYGKSHGNIWACLPCGAWVGVHKGTTRALGRLANDRLRELKKQAHAYFDLIWQRAVDGGFKKQEARSKAYKWLAKQMRLDENRCHIGQFNEIQCKKAIYIVMEWEEKYPNFFL